MGKNLFKKVFYLEGRYATQRRLEPFQGINKITDRKKIIKKRFYVLCNKALFQI